MSYKIIKASEIGEYVYCNRAWWLKRNKNIQSQNIRELNRGTNYHSDHGQQVRLAMVFKRIALIFLFLAVGVLAYWIVSQLV